MVFQATQCSSLLGLCNLEFSAAIFPTLKLQNSIVICGSHHVDQLVEENKIQHIRVNKFFRPFSQFFVLESNCILSPVRILVRAMAKMAVAPLYVSYIGSSEKDSSSSLIHLNLAD